MSDVELYKRHRPQKPSEMFGQTDAINQIGDMIKRNEIPHCMLFVGASGCGKTTLARMLARRLGCNPDDRNSDYREINASEDRGIDMVREMLETVSMSPLSGKCKVYVIDEAHGMTPQAQSAMLKPLEDGYKHVYFFLCTTDPQKLKDTVKTRATIIKLAALQPADLEKAIRHVLQKEQKTLDDDIISRIASAANGSGRKALVILHQVMGIADKESQIRSIGDAADPESTAFKLAQLVYRKNASWSEISTILKNLKDAEEQPEEIRRVILGYGRSILIGKSDNGYKSFVRSVMDEFRFNYFDTAHAGLAMSCYDVVHVVK